MYAGHVECEDIALVGQAAAAAAVLHPLHASHQPDTGEVKV